MARMKKKGTSGNAKNFITRTQAVKKLQISLPDFRRLCIYKGIYPREPRNRKKAKKSATASTTFYYTKDIQYLLHEPVLQKFREHKTFAKKLSKALGRQDYAGAKRLDKLHRPRVKLDHIVKERYPSFTDALRDLDDAISMLFLFANLPADRGVPQKTIATCEKLCAEFQHYIIRTHALRKSFLSIKGIYYQAEINGQDVLWLVPYKYAQNVPADVDFRIMLTFIDFYTTLMGFVLFRLYTIEGLVYPPKFDPDMDAKAAGLRSFVLENKGVKLLPDAATTDKNQNDVSKQLATLGQKIASLDENAANDVRNGAEENDDDVKNDTALDTFVPAKSKDGTITGDVLLQPGISPLTLATNGDGAHGAQSDPSNLFGKFTFYLSRETPREALEFLLRAFGCKRIGWDAVLGEGSFTEDVNDPSITHQVVDRPPAVALPPIPEDNDNDEGQGPKKSNGVSNGRVPQRIYVQPQYVWDCANAGRLLKPEDYAPGAELPPHLSPWVKPKEGEYDPTAPVDVGAESGSEEEGVDVDMDEEAGDISDEQDEEEEEDEGESGDDEWSGFGNVEVSSKEEEDDEDEEEDKDIKIYNGDGDEDEDEDLTPEEASRIRHQRELEAEAAGLPYAEDSLKSKLSKRKKSSKSSAAEEEDAQRKQKKRRQQEEKDEMDRQKMMMSKRKRKLYEKMVYGNQKRAGEAEKLTAKRRRIEKEKKKKDKKSA